MERKIICDTLEDGTETLRNYLKKMYPGYQTIYEIIYRTHSTGIRKQRKYVTNQQEVDVFKKDLKYKYQRDNLIIIKYINII